MKREKGRDMRIDVESCNVHSRSYAAKACEIGLTRSASVPEHRGQFNCPGELRGGRWFGLCRLSELGRIDLNVGLNLRENKVCLPVQPAHRGVKGHLDTDRGEQAIVLIVGLRCRETHLGVVIVHFAHQEASLGIEIQIHGRLAVQSSLEDVDVLVVNGAFVGDVQVQEVLLNVGRKDQFRPAWRPTNRLGLAGAAGTGLSSARVATQPSVPSKVVVLGPLSVVTTVAS